jgi:molybdenum cofactor synthesis domain-containing protein
MIRAAILTISDRCANGEKEDRSTPVLEEVLSENGFELAGRSLVPDEQDVVARELVRFCDEERCNVVFTTGGTGLGPRDVTPEATASVCERLAPGIAELMRAESLKKTRYAALSRGIVGLRGSTLIVNLPGSPKAVRECLEAILEILPHAIEMMHGAGH